MKTCIQNHDYDDDKFKSCIFCLCERHNMLTADFFYILSQLKIKPIAWISEEKDANKTRK